MKHTPDCDENQTGCNYKSLNINPDMELKYLRGVNEKNYYSDDPIIIKRYSSNFKGVMAQFMMAAVVFILIAGSRMTINYNMKLYHKLSEINETLNVASGTEWDTIRILLTHWAATAFGALVSGPLIDFIGRRGCLQFASLSLLLGWIIIRFSKYIHQVYLGSILLGFAAGSTDAPTKVILAEMSDPRLRGMLLGATGVAYLAGNSLFSYLSAEVPWDTLCFYGTITSILGFVALCWVHESPAWLIRKKKREAAIKALLWLRGGDKAQVNSEVEILEARANSNLPWKFNPAVTKPLIIINVFNVLCYLSGAYTFISVYVTSLNNGSFNNYSIVKNFVLILCASVLLLMMGRRTLGLLSGLGIGFFSLIMAYHAFVEKEVADDDIYINVCLSIYVLASTVGFMFLHGVMVGELLPQTARGLGGGFIFFLLHIIYLAGRFFHMEIQNLIGEPEHFLICGTFAFINFIFIYFFLPETQDQTLQEIEDYFQEENILWMNRKKERIQAEPLI